ncbi:hypothetical protein KCU78_g14273, partial [Aureobasidium melanogenum]
MSNPLTTKTNEALWDERLDLDPTMAVLYEINVQHEINRMRSSANPDFSRLFELLNVKARYRAMVMAAGEVLSAPAVSLVRSYENLWAASTVATPAEQSTQADVPPKHVKVEDVQSTQIHDDNKPPALEDSNKWPDTRDGVPRCFNHPHNYRPVYHPASECRELKRRQKAEANSDRRRQEQETRQRVASYRNNKTLDLIMNEAAIALAAPHPDRAATTDTDQSKSSILDGGVQVTETVTVELQEKGVFKLELTKDDTELEILLDTDELLEDDRLELTLLELLDDADDETLLLLEELEELDDDKLELTLELLLLDAEELLELELDEELDREAVAWTAVLLNEDETLELLEEEALLLLEELEDDKLELALELLLLDAEELLDEELEELDEELESEAVI